MTLPGWKGRQIPSAQPPGPTVLAVTHDGVDVPMRFETRGWRLQSWSIVIFAQGSAKLGVTGGLEAASTGYSPLRPSSLCPQSRVVTSLGETH